MKLKKILALVMALALVCTVFAACGGNSGNSTPAADNSKPAENNTPASTPAENNESTASSTGEKVITINAGMEPTGLNTLTSTYSIEFSTFNHLYEGLYELDDNDVPVPGAAESIDVSDDMMKYTFHMRPDGKWTNGDPVTANDFAFAWSQVLNPEVAADYAYFLYFIKNAEAYYNGECSWEDVGVKVIDDMTLEVELGTPTPYAPFLFSFGTLLPVNQKFYEEVGADKYATEAEYFCTNGPFKMTSWTHDSEYVTEKFEDFHGAADIEADKIVWKIITDGQAALTSYLSGELDMVGLGTGELVKQAEAQGNEIFTYPDGATFYIYMNHNDQYLQNKNLRKALCLGFDKQGMIDAVQQNNNLPATSLTTPAVTGADGKSFAESLKEWNGGEELSPAHGDVEAAKAYLETALSELGCTVEDLSAHLSVDCGDGSESQAMAAYYQEQWRQNLGIEITVNPMITKQGSANRRDGNFVMSLTGWGPDYNDPMTFMDLWVTGGGNNQTGYSSAEYDKLIADATVETDLAKRQELFYQAEKLFVEDAVNALTYWRMVDYTYDTNKIAGGIHRSTFQDINVAHVKFK